MTELFWFVFVCLCISSLIKIVKACEDAKLRKEHPEVWVRKREIDLNEKRLAFDRKRVTHDRTKMAVGIGTALAKLFLK